MPEIALLTAANLVSDAPDRRADAHLFDLQLDILRQGLSPHGLTLTPVRWIDPIDWTRFAAVLVNCAWDYQDRHEDFLAALAHMPQASGIAMGADRVVMLATGAGDVARVMWTPDP